MENASKALIIAGAILLSISIIGIGMYVFSQASEAMEGAGLSEEQIATYNGDFERYQGTQKGANVRSLCDKVRNHNLANVDDPSKQIILMTGSAAGIVEAPSAAGEAGTTAVDINAIKTTVLTGKTYTIDFGYDTNSGLIVAIGITVKQ